MARSFWRQLDIQRTSVLRSSVLRIGVAEIARHAMHWGSLVLLATFLSPLVNDASSFADDGGPQVRTRLTEAIKAYQEAFELRDKEERTAAFKNVEVAFSSLLLDLPIEESGYSSTAYCAWGNAALQANRIGIAILAYRRALFLEPTQQQSLKNLQYAQSQLPDWTQKKQDSPDVGQRLFFWRDWVGVANLRLASACFFAVGCLLVAISLSLRIPWLRSFGLIPFLIWVLLSVATLEFGARPKGIVFVADETQCRTADSVNSPLSFDTSIPAGTEGAVLENREGWLKVEVGDKKQGWVPASAVQTIE